MNIYKISQNVNNGYNTYDSAVVYAKNEEEAKRIHPSYIWEDDGVFYDEDKKEFWGKCPNSEKTYLFEDKLGSWTNDLDQIEVELLGKSNNNNIDSRIIVASFNAG